MERHARKTARNLQPDGRDRVLGQDDAAEQAVAEAARDRQLQILLAMEAEERREKLLRPRGQPPAQPPLMIDGDIR